MLRRTRALLWLAACAVVLAAWHARPVLADGKPPDFEGPYRLETKPGPRVRVVLEGDIRTPRLEGKDWVLVAPVAPTHAWQAVHAFDFASADEALAREQWTRGALGEADPQDRPVQHLRLSAKNGRSHLRYAWTLEATLQEVKLVKGRPKGPAPKLAGAERERALAANARYTLEDPRFRSWLDRHGLERGKRERDLAFAWRVLTAIHADFQYAYPPRFPERRPGEVCEEKASDCGGLSLLFSAALRANGVPARIVVGRWAIADKDADPQYHVRAEFFAEGVGWVPVDGSGAVTWNGAPGSAFGRHDANFVVMHVDSDVEVDSLIFGRHGFGWIQTPLYWVRGSGTFDGAKHDAVWKVRRVSPR